LAYAGKFGARDIKIKIPTKTTRWLKLLNEKVKNHPNKTIGRVNKPTFATL
jgi:hypothetical protein